MSVYYVYDMNDLYAVVDHLDFFAEGDQVRCEGRISQNISKAFNAYHKALSTRSKARLGLGAAVGTLGFGPAGWLVSGGALAGVMATSSQLKETRLSYRALPCASEVEDLARAGFELISNTGEAVVLSRVRT